MCLKRVVFSTPLWRDDIDVLEKMCAQSPWSLGIQSDEDVFSFVHAWKSKEMPRIMDDRWIFGSLRLAKLSMFGLLLWTRRTHVLGDDPGQDGNLAVG